MAVNCFVSLQDEFFAATDSFEENSQYRLSIKLGDGAFGKCYLAELEIPADNTIKGRLFCVKKVRKNCYFVQFSMKFSRYLT